MKIYHWVIGATLFALTSCGGGEEKSETKKKDDLVSMAFKPTAGEKKEMVYEFNFDLPSQKAKVGFVCDLLLEVKSTEAGKHAVSLRYNKVCANGNYAGIDIQLCSGDPVKTELMRVVTPVFSYLNAEYLMQFDDRMRKTEEKLVASDSTAGQAGLTSKMQFFTVLPDSAIAVGDTWEEDLDWSAANQKKARITYTFEKLDGKQAILSFKGQLKTEGEGFGEQYVMEATLSGSIKVDVETGWTTGAEMKQEVSMKVGEKPAETATYTYRMTMK